ncbi:MAG: DUF4097 family beta strand repeat protein [Ahniella sp.]|nr:DUF4097 family beta strand repeat protein [Ahniella sp.]
MNGLNKVLMLTLLSGPALAATPIATTTKALDAQGTLEVSNISGAVTVTAWDRNEVSYDGSLGDGCELKVTGTADRLTIEVEVKEGGGGGWFGWGSNGPKEPTTLNIKVPRQASLDLSGVSASLDVRDLIGSERIEAESVSGNVTVASEANAIELSSVSGDVDFRGKTRSAELGTVSGDIEINEVQGDVSADSVSGDVLIRGAAVTRFEGATVSGDLVLDGSLAANADISMESVSGGLSLVLPAATSARVSGESFSGSVNSDFALDIDDEGPGKTFSGSLGAGGGRINLESFSGDVSLRKR